MIRIVLAAALLALAQPALAQDPAPAAAPPATAPPQDLEPPFGLKPRDVVDFLNRREGLTVELLADQSQPVIRVTGDQLEWLVVFYGCRGDLCPDAQFSAAFRNPSITIETINEWNRTRRYLKASFEAGDPPAGVVQHDIMLTRRTNMEELDQHLLVWRRTLPRFALMVGYFVPEGDEVAGE